MIPLFWYRWLLAAIVGVMLFGLSMLLTPSLIRQFFSLLLYATPGAIESRFGGDANAYIQLLHAILGAVLFGWGLAMLLILRGPFRRGDSFAWTLLALPLLAWYLPDTLFSIASGFWQNAVFNTAFALLFGVPLAATRRHFRLTAPPLAAAPAP
ncbi:MAG: hypothetical protein ABWY06_22515 [Pseudomonas sp.]|uniref:hypothetical protein n=1 Tax=Pseudomonas sp. TaxID=306 RepID=UPI003399551B